MESHIGGLGRTCVNYHQTRDRVLMRFRDDDNLSLNPIENMSTAERQAWQTHHKTNRCNSEG